METENKETDCVMPQSKTTQVILEGAHSVARMQFNQETGDNFKNSVQHQQGNSHKVDPLGIDILDKLSNIPKDDAILYIMCHISQFHELVNQKLIQDRQLSILIRFVGKFSSMGPHLELRAHINRIVTNPNFLGNILRYMTDSIAPKVDPFDNFDSVHRVLNAGNKNFTVKSALKHLLAYFTFVQENMKEFASVEFTECSNVLWQLLDGKEHSKDNAQQSRKTNFGEDFELNSVNSTAPETKGLLYTIKTPFMSIVNCEESSVVIKLVYNRRKELCALANSNFNLFLHILGNIICHPVCDPYVDKCQTELLLLISTPNFLKQLSNYTITLTERFRKCTALKSAAENSESPYFRSTCEVFEEVLQYCGFLTTYDPIRDLFPADVYTEFDKCVKAANEFLVMCTAGEVLELSNKHHQALYLLKSLYDQTAGELKGYLWYLRTTTKSPKAHTASSRPSRILSQAQKAQETFQQDLQNKLKAMNISSKIPMVITSSQLVQPTADVLTLDNLTQICGMPVDEVLDMMCTERRNFVKFIIQREISDDQLILIAVIWSTICDALGFVHFQKSVFSLLLDDAFLSRVFAYTRQRLRHFGKQKTQLYKLTTAFFGSLFTIYNLLWIHSESEPEEHLTLLKKNIRSVHDQLARLTVTYPQNNKMTFDGSTLAALGRFNGRFKNLAEATKERTVGKSL